MAIDDTVKRLADICEMYLKDTNISSYFLVFKADARANKDYVIVSEHDARGFLHFLGKNKLRKLEEIYYDTLHLDEVFSRYHLMDKSYAGFVDGLKEQTRNEIGRRDLTFHSLDLIFVFPARHDHHSPLARGGRIDMNVFKYF